VQTLAGAFPHQIAVSVNAPPVITSDSGADVELGVATSIKGFFGNGHGISISDADAGSANEQIRVELKEHDGSATLSANANAPGGGGTIQGSGTGDLVITGTLAQVNANLSTVTILGSQS